jgi:hypothetical protein
MSTIGQPKREAQNRVIYLFCDKNLALKQGIMPELFAGRTRLI